MNININEIRKIAGLTVTESVESEVKKLMDMIFGKNVDIDAAEYKTEIFRAMVLAYQEGMKAGAQEKAK